MPYPITAKRSAVRPMAQVSDSSLVPAQVLQRSSDAHRVGADTASNTPVPARTVPLADHPVFPNHVHLSFEFTHIMATTRLVVLPRAACSAQKEKS